MKTSPVLRLALLISILLIAAISGTSVLLSDTQSTSVYQLANDNDGNGGG